MVLRPTIRIVEVANLALPHTIPCATCESVEYTRRGGRRDRPETRTTSVAFLRNGNRRITLIEIQFDVMICQDCGSYLWIESGRRRARHLTSFQKLPTTVVDRYGMRVS